MTEQSRDDGQVQEDPAEQGARVPSRRGFLGRTARTGAAVVVLTVHHRRALADTISISSAEACASMGGTFRTESDTSAGVTTINNYCDNVPTPHNSFSTTTRKKTGKGH